MFYIPQSLSRLWHLSWLPSKSYPMRVPLLMVSNPIPQWTWKLGCISTLCQLSTVPNHYSTYGLSCFAIFRLYFTEFGLREIRLGCGPVMANNWPRSRYQHDQVLGIASVAKLEIFNASLNKTSYAGWTFERWWAMELAMKLRAWQSKIGHLEALSLLTSLYIVTVHAIQLPK